MTMVTAASHLATPHIAYLSILPVLILLGGAIGILAVSSLSRRHLPPSATTAMTVGVGLAALGASLAQWADVRNHGPHVAVGGAVVQDGFSVLVSILVTCAVVLTALVADTWMRRESSTGPELDVLMLVSASGAVIMGEANDLVVVFLGLEVLSIALYVLAAMNARRQESGEAGIKYFVLGSFSSAVFVYGIALVYGATGTTNIPQLADYLSRNVLLHEGLLLAGMALLLVGFGFKIAAVPFHVWTPDVYQGSPSPVTGFMAAVAKAGGFAALLRVFVSSFGVLRTDWQPAVWVLAAITLLLGAIVALVQQDLKRMLAYSSINHAGFVLLGVQAATPRGVEAALYYLFTYTFMVIGSFAVITLVAGRGDTRSGLDRYRGLSRRAPWLALSLTVLLLAQAGIPFTTGFLAKLEVVSAAVGAGSVVLAVVAMVSAAIAAFFYLRVVLVMYGTSAPGLTPEPDLAVALPAPAPAPAPAAVPAAVPAAGGPGVVSGDADVVASAAATAASPTTAATGQSSTAADTDTAPAVTGDAEDELSAAPPATVVAVALCVGVTVLFGIWPDPLTDFAHLARLIIS